MSPLPPLPNNLNSTPQSVSNLLDTQANSLASRFGEINNQIGGRITNITRQVDNLSTDAKIKKDIIDRSLKSIENASSKLAISGSVNIDELENKINQQINTYQTRLRIPKIPILNIPSPLSLLLRALPKITLPSKADFTEAKNKFIERKKTEQQKATITALVETARVEETPFTARETDTSISSGSIIMGTYLPPDPPSTQVKYFAELNGRQQRNSGSVLFWVAFPANERRGTSAEPRGAMLISVSFTGNTQERIQQATELIRTRGVYGEPPQPDFVWPGGA